MSTVERILLIINRTAGTGQNPTVTNRLQAMVANALDGQATSQVVMVDDHQSVRTRAHRFLMAADAPAAIIAGGGGGTLRAVIEGICQGSETNRLPGPERVRVATLRMGSGNVLARQFGVPRDPEAGLRGILNNLRVDRIAPCCVMRCEVGTLAGASEVHYAATLGGLGQFGRIPSDLARWHHRVPGLHKLIARLFGIERLTNVEYGLILLIRTVLCALLPHTAEVIEVRTREQNQTMRLLTGLVMNFPFKALPLDPGTHVEEEALSVNLIPLRQRLSALLLVLAPRRLVRSAWRIKVKTSEQVEIRLVDRDFVEFFLDEDPTLIYRYLTLQVAGSLAFVPGPEYSCPSEREIL